MTVRPLDSSCPIHVLVIFVHLLPLVTLDTLVSRLKEGVPVCIHQWRLPPVISNVLCMDARLFELQTLLPSKLAHLALDE